MKICVSAPTRLHFGLLHFPAPGEVPTFGGLGAMLESPRVEVVAEESNKWQFDGTLANRAQLFIARFLSQKHFHNQLMIRADGPPEHTGLGVGTALELSLAAALLRSQGLPDLGVDILARVAGRGERSQIGVRGFAIGNFLLDDGPHSDSFVLQVDWRFALLSAPSTTSWHGERERAAFARPRTRDLVEAATQKLRAILEHDLLPALAAADFPRFAAALAEYNRTAGEPFAEDQGGPFASPEIANLIQLLVNEGFPGAGQSSWGPTVYVPLPDDRTADRLAARFPEARITSVAEQGATIRVTE